MCQITINNVQTKGYKMYMYLYLPIDLVSAELMLLEESFWRLHNATDYNK